MRHEKNIENYITKRLNLDSNKITLLPKNQIEDYERTVNHNRLTTGLYSIMWAIDNYNKIYIHGFDFFLNSKSHYYDSKLMNFFNNKILNKGHKHDNKKEYDFIINLIKKEKIKRL